MVTERTTCRLCGGCLRVLLSLPDTPLANEYPRAPSPKQERFPLELRGCVRCGHVQLGHVVDPRRLFPEDYPYQSGTSPVFREHLAGLADEVATLMRPGQRLLDIACNDGTFVKMFDGVGVTAEGIDPAAPEGMHRAFFTEEWASWQRNKGGASYHVITALNVFAHVDDLDDFTRGIATLLEPGGWFVFEVGYLGDVIERGLFDVIYHEHLSYHHLAPLQGFLSNRDLSIVDAERIESQGGSIRVYARKGFYARSDRMRELLVSERDQTRPPLAARVYELADRIKHVGRQLANFAKQSSGKMDIYGAPAKLTTLIHATGLYPSSVGVVYDDNPLKVGRYVPGTSIPIVPSSELAARKPKGVMIASWNFADEIMSRHRDVCCRWMVPLTEPTFYGDYL